MKVVASFGQRKELINLILRIEEVFDNTELSLVNNSDTIPVELLCVCLMIHTQFDSSIKRICNDRQFDDADNQYLLWKFCFDKKNLYFIIYSILEKQLKSRNLQKLSNSAFTNNFPYFWLPNRYLFYTVCNSIYSKNHQFKNCVRQSSFACVLVELTLNLKKKSFLTNGWKLCRVWTHLIRNMDSSWFALQVE